MKVKNEIKKVAKASFAVSMLAHGALLLLIGGFVVIEKQVPASPPFGELFSEDGDSREAPLDMPEETLPELTDSVQSLTPDAEPSMAPAEDASASMSDILVSQAPASFTVAPGLSPNSLSLQGMAGGKNGTGGGTGSGGTGAGGGGRTIRKLFGTEVAAERLGVLVDVSGTATPFILPTLKEIQKNFEEATIVLASGCALSVPRGTAKPFSGFDLSIPSPTGPAGYNALGYIKGTMALDDNVKKLMLKLQKDPKVWLMEGNGVDVTTSIQKLVDEKVDAIYWFSDFRDGVREDLVKKITADLKSRGIKLYIHTFTGQPVPALQQSMVEATGGQTIVKVPK